MLLAQIWRWKKVKSNQKRNQEMSSNRLTNKAKLLSLDSKQVRILLKIYETDNHRVLFRLIFERLLISEWERWAGREWQWDARLRKQGVGTERPFSVMKYRFCCSSTPWASLQSPLKFIGTQYPLTGRHLHPRHVKQRACFEWLPWDTLSDTLHTHIGHNHLHTWLTGGQINAIFFRNLRGLALNIYFLKMGSDPRPCVKRW